MVMLHKPNAVVVVNPVSRGVNVLNLSSKYNFVPILLLSYDKMALKDNKVGIKRMCKEFPKKNKNVVFLVDKGNQINDIVNVLKKKYNVICVTTGADDPIKYCEILRKKLGLKHNDIRSASK
jgi:hypothetical protein